MCLSVPPRFSAGGPAVGFENPLSDLTHNLTYT